MIAPADFKRRYIEHITSDPLNAEIPGFVDELSQFDVYDADTLRSLGVKEPNLEFLTMVGLPSSAAPFLAFRKFDLIEVDDMRACMSLPKDFCPIGSNGGGDLVVIDVRSGSILLFRHDENVEPQFLSSSVAQLAEALCLINEHFEMRNQTAFLSAIFQIDPPAAAKGTMWHEESANIAALNSLP